ncbi:hypothetical protein ACIREE_34505 [Streptomyces sp. NPDC102467]|uniref:hypothetical protein n=1 Tax=Streptomyces sp. NPDC102467 TaxID=3366179 RepID=UPI00380BE343
MDRRAPNYASGMRNSKAFKGAVAQTLAALAHRGVTLAPATVEDFVEDRIAAVAA